MHRVLLAVRVVTNGETTAGYYRELELPFVPTIGMRFEQGISTTIWETTHGKGELDPAVERVIYDLDEQQFICLFTVKNRLDATFWQDIEDPNPDGSSHVMRYFRHC